MQATSIAVAGIAVSLLVVPADLLQASKYDPGFTWDWRIDFGTAGSGKYDHMFPEILTTFFEQPVGRLFRPSGGSF